MKNQHKKINCPKCGTSISCFIIFSKQREYLKCPICGVSIDVWVNPIRMATEDAELLRRNFSKKRRAERVDAEKESIAFL